MIRLFNRINQPCHDRVDLSLRQLRQHSQLARLRRYAGLDRLERYGRDAGAHDGDCPTLADAVVYIIDQQEIAADVAVKAALPVALQRMIAPIRSQ